MFSNDITLNGGGTDVVYALTSIVNGKSVRSQAVAPIGAPRTLTISHQPKNATPGAPTRHMVRIDSTKTDTAGVQASATAYIVIEEPQQQFTTAEVTECVKELLAFATDANILKLLNDEP